jgi:hydrogenase maturation protease
MKISILGIGQPLRGDDGAGPETVRRWRRDFPSSDPSIETVFLETPGLGLLEYLEAADAAILVDAVSSGAPAGTLHAVSLPAAPDPTPGEKTAHGFGVAESIALARNIGTRLPEHLLLIGIEAEGFAPGSGLSDAVRTAIPEAAGKIQETVERWKALPDQDFAHRKP